VVPLLLLLLLLLLPVLLLLLLPSGDPGSTGDSGRTTSWLI